MKRFLVLVLCVFIAHGFVHAALISHFTLDGNVLDSGPGGNDGTFVGAADATFTEGFDGTANGAIALDGVDDFIDVAENNGLPILSNEAFTIAMWVKGPIQNDKRIFSESSTDSDKPLFNLGTTNSTSNGKFSLFLRNDAGGTPVNHRNSAREPFDDTWHHIAWSDNNGETVLFIDGVPDSVNYNYTRQTLTITKTTIGGILRGSACCFFKGAIDDVYLYDQALTQHEIIDLMGTPAFCPPEGDPDYADTHLTDIQVDSPPNNLPGYYTITATATDDTGDDILYTIVADDGNGQIITAGPGLENSIKILMTPGMWTVMITADDEFRCQDRADDAVGQAQVLVNGDPKLISHWTFDGNLSDTGDAGAANDGTFVGGDAPTFTEGFDGTPDGAILLDGVDDFVNISQNGGLPIYTTTKAYTIAMWVKGEPQNDMRVFSEASTTSNVPLVNIGCQNVNNDGRVRIYMRGSSTYAGASDRIAFDNTWHHITWVDDAGQAVMYIDGIRDASNFTYTHPSLTANTTTIGGILRADPSHFFAGAIDDVRIYNYALTQEEILGIIPEPATCPADGDTHCTDLSIAGPDGQVEGTYTATCTATDDSGDDIVYIFTLLDGQGTFVRQIGPQAENTADFTLAPGDWSVSVSVDDDIWCRDQAADASQTKTLTVYTEPPALIANLSLDGNLEDAEAGNNGTLLSYVDDGTGVFSAVEETPVFENGFDCTSEGSLSFDGTKLVKLSYAEGGSLPTITRSTFSIAMWVKGLPQADKRLFSESSTQQDNLLYNIGTHNTGADGTLDIYIRDDTGATQINHAHSTGIVFDDTWHHIVWVDDEGNSALFIDGSMDATDFTYTRGTYTPDITTLGGILREDKLPGNPACCFFTGQLDDVRIYNYILSSEDVTALYGDGPSAHCCPIEGSDEYADTHCQGLTSEGGPGAGIYTFTSTATDATGDDISYTFSADNGEGTTLDPSSQTGNVAEFDLTDGTWTVTVTVDDDPLCPDEADDTTCSEEVIVESGVKFKRGDVNTDNTVNLADAIVVLTYLFNQGENPACMDSADANDDETINLADAISILGYLFNAEGPLPEPFEACGLDPDSAEELLDCESFSPCE